MLLPQDLVPAMTTPVSLTAVQVADANFLQIEEEKFMRQHEQNSLVIQK